MGGNREKKTVGGASLIWERQISLPEIGEKGQERLRDASVLIAGLGGLGSISSMYLCAAGIGKLVLVDSDEIESSNLNRQLLHRSHDLGKRKTESAKDALRALNPSLNIELRDSRIEDLDLKELFEGVDAIVDGTDNLSARKLLNKASVEKGVPLVYGSVGGFDGMLTVFVPGKTACLECVFPSPPATMKPVGVLGSIPGVIGSLQALETTKLILGLPSPLVGKMLFFKGLTATFRTAIMDKSDECAVCGTRSQR